MATRPGKSAHDAVSSASANCHMYGWIIDLDIKGFFDNLNHDKMMQLLKLHTQEQWILLYVERWLKAGVEIDGVITGRQSGTPQGGVISPLLTNIYLPRLSVVWLNYKSTAIRSLQLRIFLFNRFKGCYRINIISEIMQQFILTHPMCKKSKLICSTFIKPCR